MIAHAALPLTQVFRKAESIGLTLPPATPSRAYILAKLISFGGKANQRGDAFRAEDISDDCLRSLPGAPLIGNRKLDDHSDVDGRRIQIGSVVNAVKQEDGIYIVASVDRETLQQFGLDATDLSTLAVSMEAAFDPSEAEYIVNGQTLDRAEALQHGIANPDAARDDRRKYESRLLRPVEFPRVALLKRGRQADETAHVLQAAASRKTKTKSLFDLTDDESSETVAEIQELLAQLRAEASASRDDRATVESRIGELEKWRHLDDEERQSVRQVVIETLNDDLAWLKYKVAWFDSTLKQALAAAHAARVPPTLTTHGRSSRDIFDFTDEE